MLLLCFAFLRRLLFDSAGEPPSAFPQRRLKVDFSRVHMSQRLETLLTGLLQPAWEDRPTAAQAQKVLDGRADSSQQQRRQDRFSQNVWERSGGESRSSGSGRQVSMLCTTQFMSMNAFIHAWQLQGVKCNRNMRLCILGCVAVCLLRAPGSTCCVVHLQ